MDNLFTDILQVTPEEIGYDMRTDKEQQANVVLLPLLERMGLTNIQFKMMVIGTNPNGTSFKAEW